MVLLAMTPALADSVSLYLSKANDDTMSKDVSLEDPCRGKAISHEQIIHISRFLQGVGTVDTTSVATVPTRLDEMLKGCSLYRLPPAPKAAPPKEYLELMAKLRASEEERTYASMLPTSAPSNPFSVLTGASTKLHATEDDDEKDSIVRESDSRQVTVVFNIFVSIICTFFALFFAARSWSSPPRVALALFGSLGVGVAEVGVYLGYLNRMDEARKTERKRGKVEVKEIVEGKSWVIEGKKAERLKKRTGRRKEEGEEKEEEE